MLIFTKHPSSVGENYSQHFLKALGYSFYSLYTSFIFFLHAFLPFLYKTKGSDRIKKLNSILQARRNRSTIWDDKSHACSVDSNTCSIDKNNSSSNSCSI